MAALGVDAGLQQESVTARIYFAQGQGLPSWSSLEAAIGAMMAGRALDVIHPELLRVADDWIAPLGLADGGGRPPDIDLSGLDARSVAEVLGTLPGDQLGRLFQFSKLGLTTAIPRDAIGERLAHHRAVLTSNGVPELRDLGTLDLDGAVTPQNGVSVPTPGLYLHQVPYSDAKLSHLNGGELYPTSGTANVLATLPAPVEVSGVIPLDTAYWAAREIRLAPGSLVILRRPQKYLTIICERIVFGAGSSITWEEPPGETLLYNDSPFKKPAKPDKPPREPLDGYPGAQGGNGATGQDRLRSEDGPTVEIWAMEVEGSPVVCLRGQNGLPGGDGQHGGDGGDGGDGLDEVQIWRGWPVKIFVDCRHGHGAGGDGGPPGAAGNGGRGGDGGHGGRFTLFALEPQLDALKERGLLVNCWGGDPGPGGGGGASGVGGNGGARGGGDACRTSTFKESGRNWTQENGDTRGPAGADGPSGGPGGYDSDATRLVPITEEQFLAELVKPVLVQVEPIYAAAGTAVSVTGLRFAASDVVYVGGDLYDQPPTPAPTEVLGPTLLCFVVPAVLGGRQQIQLYRGDQRSNRATLVVTPIISAVEPQGRLNPGDFITILGGGFTPDATVRIAGADMPEIDVSGAARGQLRCRVQRPSVLPKKWAEETGEHAELTVVIPADGGTASPSFPVVIDTYRTLVVGDSVLWGQGLGGPDKIHELVEQRLLAGPVAGGRMVYTTHRAHSGATIGVGESGYGLIGAAIEGEVPISWPTVLQQATDYAAETGRDPASVDLVLLDGGINDVNIRRILNPLTPMIELAQLIDRHCYGSMRHLLAQVADKYPNATIVVTGYYPLVSHHSDTNLLRILLAAIGITVSLPDPLLGAVASRARLFHGRSRVDLEAAAGAVNDDLDSPRVIYADAAFGEEHATLTAEPLLFGLRGGRPQGRQGVEDERRAACAVRYGPGLDRMTCENAPIGHPNEAGAQRYAEAIIAALAAGPEKHEDAEPDLPEGFLFGVATAAFQVEGDLPDSDWAFFLGSPTITDRVRKALKVANADPIARLEPPGDGVRHRDLDVLRGDLDRAAALGINAYRLSLEWSRLQPPGTDVTALDPMAVDYYRTVIRELHSRGMRPIVTLNHLTLPQWVLTPPAANGLALPDLGGVPSARETEDFRRSLRGWETRDTVDAFIRFVELVWDALNADSTVTDWITLNEPVGSMVGAGYLAGVWSPGFLLDGDRGKKAYLNLIRAHVLAHDAIKRKRETDRVGYAHNMMAIRRTSHSGLLNNTAAVAQMDYFYNEHWLNATLRGEVDIAIQVAAADRVYGGAPDFFGGGFDAHRAWPRADFIGVNYYRSVYGYADVIVATRLPYAGGAFHNNLAGADEPHYQLNSLGWEISPAGFDEVLQRLGEYHLPVLITENGLPEADDANRAAYLVAHLAAVARARAGGINVVGYLHWSLIDNWEWLDGYAPEARFGLYRVDRGVADMDGAGSRELTEAGMSYACIIASHSTGPASRLFGRFHRNGTGVRAPRESLSWWELRLSDGVRLSLVFTARMGLFRIGLRDWRPLSGVGVEPSVGRVAFTARIEDRAVSFDGSAKGASMHGTTDSGLSWDATADPLAGTWNSRDPSITELSVHGLRADRCAKALLSGGPPIWQPAQLAFTGQDVSWRVALGPFAGWHFAGRVEGDAMVGTLQATGGIASSTVWEARRRPGVVG